MPGLQTACIAHALSTFYRWTFGGNQDAALHYSHIPSHVCRLDCTFNLSSQVGPGCKDMGI